MHQLFGFWSTVGGVYYFPVAAVTNDHKFSGLKQHGLIILEFWRSQVQNELAGL